MLLLPSLRLLPSVRSYISYGTGTPSAQPPFAPPPHLADLLLQLSADVLRIETEGRPDDFTNQTKSSGLDLGLKAEGN